jgi:hypothetical protein
LTNWGEERCLQGLRGRGGPEGRRPLERPRRRWEDNIKTDLREVAWGHGLDLSGSEQGQMADGNELSGSIKFREFLE